MSGDTLESLREGINRYLRAADYEAAAPLIAKAVPKLLQISVDEWREDPADSGSVWPSASGRRDGKTALAAQGDSTSDSDSDSDDSSGSSPSSDEDDEPPRITSYRYRSTLHLPRNPRLEHLCTWLYDTVVHPEDPESEPEEQACQKLPAAILAAWRLMQTPPPPTPASAAGASAAMPSSSAALSPTEALHLQHAPFSTPFCTWRPVSPDALPPLHDVLVGVLRVCWERHDDREPSRNIIWGAHGHSRRDDPVTAYLYVEYLRLLMAAIVRSAAEPLWLWHELQEVIEEYPHWRHHPHEVAVLARMMVEAGCGFRLLNSVLDHIGRAPMLMYGCWAALWDGLRRPEARACVRAAAAAGVRAEAVWAHAVELTLLQVKEHPHDAKLLDRAVAVLSRCLALTPAPVQLAALLRAERDAPGSCEGVRAVTSQLDLATYLGGVDGAGAATELRQG
ncbi:hypothetical protein GPECTOR_12g594 [Gonium pectorale]|uniref:Uncharacterized protein n=1 Tax=Gonium pectorale TaxID=33097 RepID=A0A150GQL1_GONPE|nr:hypothetical protein GPECTOR_12g594 [Gonium pectorale]|eukprot:KXZ51630.1 hypothetical protein GPECTOR_12g594 [Gonium pectorale]